MNPLSGLTMYDALTMLVSGYMWSILFFQTPQDDTCSSVFFGVLCYIIGLIYHRLFDFVAGYCKCLRNDQDLIKKAYDKVWKKFSDKLKGESTIENYHAAYYCLMKNNSLNSIPILEAQVAFCRNLVPILCVYLAAMSWGCGIRISTLIDNLIECRCSDCAAGIMFVLMIGLLIGIWRYTQYKIHVLVWEGSCFIQDPKDDK